MAAQRITASVPAPHRRRIRTTTALAGVTVLIAAGGYAATTTFGPDAYEPQPAPATNDTPTATDQVLRELRESVAGQYGPQPAPAPDREQAMRDYRHTVIKLYGPQPPRSVAGR
jgi:hypothetical protein